MYTYDTRPRARVPEVPTRAAAAAAAAVAVADGRNISTRHPGKSTDHDQGREPLYKNPGVQNA